MGNLLNFIAYLNYILQAVKSAYEFKKRGKKVFCFGVLVPLSIAVLVFIIVLLFPKVKLMDTQDDSMGNYYNNAYSCSLSDEQRGGVLYKAYRISYKNGLNNIEVSAYPCIVFEDTNGYKLYLLKTTMFKQGSLKNRTCTVYVDASVEEILSQLQLLYSDATVSFKIIFAIRENPNENSEQLVFYCNDGFADLQFFLIDTTSATDTIFGAEENSVDIRTWPVGSQEILSIFQ